MWSIKLNRNFNIFRLQGTKSEIKNCENLVVWQTKRNRNPSPNVLYFQRILCDCVVYKCCITEKILKKSEFLIIKKLLNIKIDVTINILCSK